MKIAALILFTITFAGCVSVVVSDPDRKADCGSAPKVTAEEIAATVRKKWPWTTSKQLGIFMPARAAWSDHYRAPEYGYVSVVSVMRLGSKGLDLDQRPFGVFYRNGSLAMIRWVLIPTMKLTLLDDVGAQERKPPEPTTLSVMPPAAQESRRP